jgi:hypothetical protein
MAMPASFNSSEQALAIEIQEEIKLPGGVEATLSEVSK